MSFVRHLMGKTFKVQRPLTYFLNNQPNKGIKETELYFSDNVMRVTHNFGYKKLSDVYSYYEMNGKININARGNKFTKLYTLENNKLLFDQDTFICK